MKKLIIGLLAAFLMSAGLVGVSSTTASAACPYQGCFKTVTGSSTSTSATRGIITAKVRAKGTTKTPIGVFRLVVKKGGKSIYIHTKRVGNGTKVFRTKKLKPGKYFYTVRYIKARDSAFLSSATRGSFRISR